MGIRRCSETRAWCTGDVMRPLHASQLRFEPVPRPDQGLDICLDALSADSAPPDPVLIQIILFTVPIGQAPNIDSATSRTRLSFTFAIYAGLFRSTVPYLRCSACRGGYRYP